jgi:hypothetical protein
VAASLGVGQPGGDGIRFFEVVSIASRAGWIPSITSRDEVSFFGVQAGRIAETGAIRQLVPKSSGCGAQQEIGKPQPTREDYSAGEWSNAVAELPDNRREPRRVSCELTRTAPNGEQHTHVTSVETKSAAKCPKILLSHRDDVTFQE